MKLFSLETKKQVAGWSVAVGFIIDLIVSRITLKAVRDYDAYLIAFGWPMRGVLSQSNIPLDKIFFQNLIFWIITALIVLSLVRWIRYKNQNSKIKSQN